MPENIIEHIENTDSFFEELLDSFKKTLPKKELLFHLFEYLKTKIPFEIITYHSIDRKTKLFTTFIEYTATQVIPSYSYYLENLVPEDSLKELFGKNNRAISINNNNQEKAHPTQAFIKQLPYSVNSYIMFPVYVANDTSYYTIISFFSSKKNVFTEEHREVIKKARQLLEDTLSALFLTSNEPYLNLSTTSSVATNFQTQLYACPSLGEVIKKIETVAKYDTSVLINGETGVGKELIAETLHSLSNRRDKPFIRVNCGAIPETLIESEFFGFEKGAFTGALQSKKGYFEEANHGTIYLDEVGELSKNAQTRLLRAIENREIQRVGGNQIIHLDIRILSATNRNLAEMVEKNEFREDLYYRLNIFPINVPNLQNRRADVPVLIEYFYSFYVRKFQLSKAPVITYKTIRQLIEFAWPGNIRQLKASMERAILEAISEDKAEVDFLFLDIPTQVEKKSKKLLTEEEILTALKKTKGKIQGSNGAAEYLNIHPATLRSKMQVLGIPFKRSKKS